MVTRGFPISTFHNCFYYVMKPSFIFDQEDYMVTLSYQMNWRLEVKISHSIQSVRNKDWNRRHTGKFVIRNLMLKQC